MSALPSTLAPSLSSVTAALPGLAQGFDAAAGADAGDFEAVLAAHLDLTQAPLLPAVSTEPALEPATEAESIQANQAAAPQVAALDPLTAALISLGAALQVPGTAQSPSPAPTPGETTSDTPASSVLARAARQPNPMGVPGTPLDTGDAPAPATSATSVAGAPASIAASPGREAAMLAEAAEPAPVLPDLPAAAEARTGAHAVSHERPHEASRYIEHATNDAPVRLGARSFDDDVGQRVVWMASNGRQAAELRLDPPQLGPVEVRLTLTGDQATLTLLSPHASVREALQTSLPRLQEMLMSAGIDLGSVHVGSHAPGDRADDGWRATPDQPPAWTPQADAPSGVPALMMVSRGLVDTYA